MLERLRLLLGVLDGEDYDHIPDYVDVLDELGLSAEDDPLDIRDAVEEGLALMELEADLADDVAAAATAGGATDQQ